MPTDDAAGHDPERHRQGVPAAAGTYIFPPEPSRRLIVDMVAFCAAARPAVEPDERLQLPPAGGGGDAGAGDRLLPGHRHRRARRRARVRPGGRADRFPAVVGSISLLRQRRHPLRRGDLQDAGLHRAVGPHLPRALRRGRPEAAPLPLRRAGQLARPHRGPAREQRAAHRARDARRHAVEGRPGPVDPAAGVERGARPAPPVGPAVVAAHPAGAGLRDRPARVRRHLRRLQGGRGPHRRAGRGGHRPSSTTCSPSAAPSRPSTS